MATTEYRLDTDDAAAAAPLETMAAWCDPHELIPGLLPFNCRRSDTFAEFETLAEALEDLPETQATFTLSELETPEGHRAVKYRPTGAGVVKTQLHLLGAWEYTKTSTGQRWINPNYVHDHPWQVSQCDDAERESILRHAARLGAVTREDVAPRFGMGKKGVQKHIYRHDLPWREWRDAGLRRLARTLLTVRAWTDRSLADIAAPFSSPDGTVRCWVHRHGRADGFTPPEDPSGHHAFQAGDGDA